MGSVWTVDTLIRVSPWLLLVVLLIADVAGRIGRHFFPELDLLNVRLAIQIVMATGAGIWVAILDRKSGSLGFMVVVSVALVFFWLLYEWSNRKMDLARENDTWTKQMETRYSLSLLAGYVVLVAVFVGFMQVL